MYACNGGSYVKSNYYRQIKYTHNTLSHTYTLKRAALMLTHFRTHAYTPIVTMKMDSVCLQTLLDLKFCLNFSNINPIKICGAYIDFMT